MKDSRLATARCRKEESCAAVRRPSQLDRPRRQVGEGVSLPQQTSQPLELALYLGEGDVADRRRLERHGWRVRHSVEVASTPEAYAAYVRGSRGESSCVKPSCLKLGNAWVSDRTLCYLASGKPVVVQDTGLGAFLPTGEGHSSSRRSTRRRPESRRSAPTTSATRARHGRSRRSSSTRTGC